MHRSVRQVCADQGWLIAPAHLQAPQGCCLHGPVIVRVRLVAGCRKTSSLVGPAGLLPVWPCHNQRPVAGGWGLLPDHLNPKGELLSGRCCILVISSFQPLSSPCSSPCALSARRLEKCPAAASWGGKRGGTKGVARPHIQADTQAGHGAKIRIQGCPPSPQLLHAPKQSMNSVHWDGRAVLAS